MDTTQDSAMVALLPQTDEWCKFDLAHTTLIYLGLIKDLAPIVKEELIKIVSSIAILTNPFPVKIIGQEVFGDTEKVEVFRLVNTSELSSLRTLLNSWDDSEFPNFRPHATIGPEGTMIQDPPLFLMFDRIMLGWGEEQLTFWLRRF